MQGVKYVYNGEGKCPDEDILKRITEISCSRYGLSRNKRKIATNFFPDWINSCRELMIIKLPRAGIVSLPSKLPESLTSLYLQDNKIISLPDVLPDSLIYIDVSRNRLRKLPNVLPSNLNFLDVSYNKINSIDCKFPLTLQELNISHNPTLTSLSDISRTKIGYLDISMNWRLNKIFITYPETLGKLCANHVKLMNFKFPQNITHLELENCGIKGDVSLTLTLPNYIMILKLSGNPITIIPDGWLKTSLTEFDLRESKIINLSFDIINCKQLKHFFISIFSSSVIP